VALSRQFKALGKITAFFAGVWGAVGVVTAALTAGVASSTLLAFSVAFASAGAISGLATALLVARGERGRRFEEIPAWRSTLWGVLGGGAPAAVFGILALLFAGNPSAIVSLMGLAAFGGVIGGTITTSAHVAGRQGELPSGDDVDLLPGKESK